MEGAEKETQPECTPSLIAASVVLAAPKFLEVVHVATRVSASFFMLSLLRGECSNICNVSVPNDLAALQSFPESRKLRNA